MAQESEQQHEQRRSGNLGWPIWVILSLPLLYLLSSGPILGLYSKGLIREPAVTLYTPLFWCAAKSPIFAKPYWSYLHFCGYNMIGDAIL